MAEYIERETALMRLMQDGCNVCADKKFCNRTICKYENEFARRKKNEMEAKEDKNIK